MKIHSSYIYIQFKLLKRNAVVFTPNKQLAIVCTSQPLLFYHHVHQVYLTSHDEFHFVICRYVRIAQWTQRQNHRLKGHGNMFHDTSHVIWRRIIIHTYTHGACTHAHADVLVRLWTVGSFHTLFTVTYFAPRSRKARHAGTAATTWSHVTIISSQNVLNELQWTG